jgi:hypothetical protein
MGKENHCITSRYQFTVEALAPDGDGDLVSWELSSHHRTILAVPYRTPLRR